jgi:hypothetical protein
MRKPLFPSKSFSVHVHWLSLIAAALCLMGVGSVIGAPANDNFSAPEVLVGSSGSGTFSLAGATVEPGEPGIGPFAPSQSVWYAWTAPAEGSFTFFKYGPDVPDVGIFLGDAVDRLTEVRPQVTDFPIQFRYLRYTFRVHQGVTYHISINYVSNNHPPGAPSDLTFRWQFYQLPNDDFANAQVISGLSGSTTGSTIGDTAEPGEPNVLIGDNRLAGDKTYAASGSLWFAWTAPVSGVFVFYGDNLIFTGANPDLTRVYTGNSLTALTPILGAQPGYITFNAVAGTRYSIQVMRNSDKNFQLSWSPAPANDNFSGAILLVGNSGSVSALTRGATEEAQDPLVWGSKADETVWYTWSAPASGLYSFHVEGTSSLFFSFLGLYTGDSLDQIALVSADFGNGNINARSDVTIRAQANTPYRIMVGRYRAFSGTDVNFTLSWRQSASPADASVLNLSTRGDVGTGDQVLIGGFIIAGNETKKVILRGMGPSMQSGGVPVDGRLMDPQLELRNAAGDLIYANDDWVNSPQKDEISRTGIPPPSDKESAIVISLSPGSYTALIRGTNQTGGIGLVEIYDLQVDSASRLLNVSTRGFVGLGSHQLIAGFIIGGSFPIKLAVRALGPALANVTPPVPNSIGDPAFFAYDPAGHILSTNGTDNWRSSNDGGSEVQARGLAPSDDREAAKIYTLVPGTYTAVMRGANQSTGMGLVEVYNIN